jgi:hypothetical protein
MSISRAWTERVVTPPIATHIPGEYRLWVNNGRGGRSSGTSALPQTADDFGAPRKSAEMGQLRTIIETLRVKEAWSKDLLVGAATYLGELSNWHIVDVYCWVSY